MLKSAVEHYRNEQRITAAGVVALRRVRFDTLDTLTRTMAAFQLLAAREALRAFPLMLSEQNVDAPAEATPVASALLGSASDGRDIRGLLDFTRTSSVTAQAFDLIVTTQLQDVARQASSIALGSRPAVDGYVRMLNLPSCSRCAVLAGKFYRRNRGFARHPKCDCRHVPATEDTAGDLRTDPNRYFESLDAAQQDAIFTKAGADVIRRGADVAQVVNARAGMSTAQVATRGPGDRWTASGRLTRSSTFGQRLYTTTEGMTTRGAAYGARGGKKVRLMPESILEIAEDDAEVLRLLKAHGYLT